MPQLPDGDAVRDLSSHLSFAFEQMNYHYQIGQLMNCLTNPAQFVEVMAERLTVMSDLDWTWIQLEAGGEQVACRGGEPPTDPGFEAACRALRERLTSDDPCLVYPPDEHEIARMSGGDIVVGPVVDDARVVGAIIGGVKADNPGDVSNIEVQLVSTSLDYLGVFEQNVSSYHQQRAQFNGTLLALTRTIDAKDPYTRGHSERVGLLASELARAIGYSSDEADRVYIAGLIHDIGKIGVPEAVLGKPGRLTDAEFDLIKQHPRIGYDIVKDIPFMGDCLPGVLHHHERWDGRGYPDGLRGDEIPMQARLLGIADTFDAMSSDRAYRSRMTRDRVLQEIRDCAGTQFCPDLAPVFVGLDLTPYDVMITSHERQNAA